MASLQTISIQFLFSIICTLHLHDTVHNAINISIIYPGHVIIYTCRDVIHPGYDVTSSDHDVIYPFHDVIYIIVLTYTYS